MVGDERTTHESRPTPDVAKVLRSFQPLPVARPATPADPTLWNAFPSNTADAVSHNQNFKSRGRPEGAVTVVLLVIESMIGATVGMALEGQYRFYAVLVMAGLFGVVAVVAVITFLWPEHLAARARAGRTSIARENRSVRGDGG